jgi:PAS domain-containing protein
VTLADTALKTAALEALRIGVVVHAADTSIVFSNPSAAQRLGLTVGQMSGRDAMGPHWALYDPDGRELAVEDYPVSRVVRMREPVIGMLLGAKGGDPPSAMRWLLVNATPGFKADGALHFVVVDFNDITDRRRLELDLENERNNHRWTSGPSTASWRRSSPAAGGSSSRPATAERTARSRTSR